MALRGELLLTAAAMAELDRRTIEELGVPGAVLMEGAAWACVQELLLRWPDEAARGVHCLCGPGNNGGDGLAIARRLHLRGLPVRASLPGGEERLSADAAEQLRLARACGVPIARGPQLRGAGVIVDALFGTGLGRPLAGPFAAAARSMARADRPVLSVDIPSGISGTSGAVHGVAVRATCTVTFGALKLGHLTEPGRSHAGELVRADIGIPAERWPEVVADAVRLLGPGALDAVPLGPSASHKGTFGHLLVVAGGPGKLGAARLACEAALRAGAGLVTLAAPGDAPPGLRPEVMVEAVPGEADGSLGPASVPAILALCRTRSALAVGPGLGSTPAVRSAVHAILAGCAAPAVVDADGLNALAPLRGAVPGAGRVLTPHPGEFRRLLPDVDGTRAEQARALARRSGAVALLKGAGTVVAGPDGAAWLNPTGHPGLATAGAGDVLTGIIGALLARGLPPIEAACAGAWWHGFAAEVAGRTPSLVAGDVSSCRGRAWSRARARDLRLPFVDRPA